MSEAVKCIDISHHQDFPDFAKVKAAGVIAMIHKATEGSSYVDKNRTTNINNATKAGIKCCTYHWLSPDSSAQSQMEFYLKTVDPVPGERMVIDYEENGCTLSQLKDAVRVLLDDPRELQVTIYSGHLLKEQLNGRDAFLADNTDLWLAQYTSGTPTWSTATYPQWALWQYSESGTVDGITGSLVDLDRCNGSDAELLQWISPAGKQPMPNPEPEAAAVYIVLNTTGLVSINLSVNGEVIYGDNA